jgi:hypothetical protein
MKRLLCLLLGHRYGSSTSVSGVSVRLCERCGRAVSANADRHA